VVGSSVITLLCEFVDELEVTGKRRHTVASFFFKQYLYATIKVTSEFKNVSVTVGVVDGLALHGKLLLPRLGASTGGVLV